VGTISTKEKILNTAIQLFSDGGYKEVSMRDIAKAVGINASSLYNHFASKEDILNALYEFYAIHWQKACPDAGDLLRRAETEPPHEVLMRLNFQFDPGVQETLNRIVNIALRQMRTDPNSERFIREHWLTGMTSVHQALLYRLIELERIEPVNVQVFSRLLSRHSVGAVLFHGTSLQMELEEWLENLELVFSLIKQKEDVSHEA
jgi:AcrR family transcriptional regulator